MCYYKQGCGNGCTLNHFQSYVKLFLHFVATIKGGIKFDIGFRTFYNKQFLLLFVI